MNYKAKCNQALYRQNWWLGLAAEDQVVFKTVVIWQNLRRHYTVSWHWVQRIQ